MDGLLIALDGIDRALPGSLALQLADRLRDAVQSGLARPGEAVPSTRVLAARLGISRGVVVRAYDQLIGEGCLEARGGSGVRIADLPTSLPSPATAARPTASSRARNASAAGIVQTIGIRADAAAAPAGIADLAPGMPSTARLDERAWRAAWRAAAARPVTPGWGDRRGEPRLRA
ncbi:GntR family transcriptional regulator, partial [Agromyces seonyuensis]|uniref:GntR family transcriptional regulator n=1 Tax=Agromyces seonyuensis TaxID=2662446 RepID=UPI001366744D